MKPTHALVLLYILFSVAACKPAKDYVVDGTIDTPEGKKLTVVLSNEHKGVIDSRDSIIVPIEFSFIHNLNKAGIVVVDDQNREGLYSYDGEMIFPNAFTFFGPYEDKTLIGVEDSLNQTLYRVDRDYKWTKLISHDKNIYRLNWVAQPYFKAVNPGETLFNLLKIQGEISEKLYLLDSVGNWTDVTSNDKYRIPLEKYYNGERVEAPADAN